jgi:hypothetical protein
VPRSARSFQGLLTAAPKPLPDDDEPDASAEPSGADEKLEPAAEEPGSRSAPETVETVAANQGGAPQDQAASQSKPASPVTQHEAPAPTSPAGTVGERVATTIRLHHPAAAALNSAWLHQRMHVNPKLSYPEFASEIVRLGLAAFERQAKRS